MKKFTDQKAPLNTYKYKLQLKAQQNSDYNVFYKELDSITTEQNKFLENLEYQVAVAEAMDPVQDLFL